MSFIVKSSARPRKMPVINKTIITIASAFDTLKAFEIVLKTVVLAQHRHKKTTTASPPKRKGPRDATAVTSRASKIGDRTPQKYMKSTTEPIPNIISRRIVQTMRKMVRFGTIFAIVSLSLGGRLKDRDMKKTSHDMFGTTTFIICRVISETKYRHDSKDTLMPKSNRSGNAAAKHPALATMQTTRDIAEV